MIPKILVSVGIVFYGLIVPVLEINATHVFNPAWVAHARLHEVWQLATNSSLGVFALWLTWFKNDIRLASLLTFLITGGFLSAYIIRDGYGGSMVHSDGTEKIIFGMNLGVFGFGLAIILTILAMLLQHRGSVKR